MQTIHRKKPAKTKCGLLLAQACHAMYISTPSQTSRSMMLWWKSHISCNRPNCCKQPYIPKQLAYGRHEHLGSCRSSWQQCCDPVTCHQDLTSYGQRLVDLVPVLYAVCHETCQVSLTYRLAARQRAISKHDVWFTGLHQGHLSMTRVVELSFRQANVVASFLRVFRTMVC